jgi:hypothetical protein
MAVISFDNLQRRKGLVVMMMTFLPVAAVQIQGNAVKGALDMAEYCLM